MFYGGLVQPKNYLHTVMQAFTICCLITCLWMIFGRASPPRSTLSLDLLDSLARVATRVLQLTWLRLLLLLVSATVQQHRRPPTTRLSGHRRF